MNECFIPLKPPSVNSLYNIIVPLKRVELKPEVRIFKSQLKMFLPKEMSVEKERKLLLDLTIYTDWYTKEDKVRKQDVSNMMKCIQDACCEKWGIDDCWIWETRIRKGENGQEGIQIRVNPF